MRLNLVKNRNKVIPLIIITTLASIFIYDYFLLMDTDGGLDLTVSAWINIFAHENPVCVLFFGILLGHLFWQSDFVLTRKFNSANKDCKNDIQ